MWSAAILAGGRARRFGGRDKSALVVGHRTILERQATELFRVTSDVMLVGGDRVQAESIRARLVTDRVPGCGPLGGLHAALAEARGDATAIVACDMPYVSAPFITHLLDLTCEADVVVPRTDDGYHPLCAAYASGCVEAVADCLAHGRLKMTDFYAALRVRIVTVEEIDAFGDHRRLLANLNTPNDYRDLEPQGHQL